MLRTEMGGPRRAVLLSIGGMGRVWRKRVGSHNRVTCSIAARIAGIKPTPRHVLKPGRMLVGGRGKGARGGRRTRLKHRNGASLLGDGLNQRSHIVSLGQGVDMLQTRVSGSIGISTRQLTYGIARREIGEMAFVSRQKMNKTECYPGDVSLGPFRSMLCISG